MMEHLLLFATIIFSIHKYFPFTLSFPSILLLIHSFFYFIILPNILVRTSQHNSMCFNASLLYSSFPLVQLLPPTFLLHSLLIQFCWMINLSSNTFSIPSTMDQTLKELFCNGSDFCPIYTHQARDIREMFESTQIF